MSLRTAWLSRFLEKTCAPPCHPSPLPLDGWKLILPCLQNASDWDLPIACWNETEKALRNPQKRPAILRGLGYLGEHCPQEVARWLRISPHNLCRTARRLGMFRVEKARELLERARQHPAFANPIGGECFERFVKQWGPLRLPEWLSEGSTEVRLSEFRKQQPALQLDLLYRLLRS